MAVQYHEVTVGGQTLRVAHERGAEYINTVATYVEHKLQALAQTTKAPLTMRLAMMTALEIADELFIQGAPHRHTQNRAAPLQE
jgi:cell division protein ZapA (FtsZ GTPase activity inhibitor)